MDSRRSSLPFPLVPRLLPLVLAGIALLPAFACRSTAADPAGPATAESIEVEPQGEPSPIAEQLTRADAEIAAIVAVPDAERTFENTVLGLDDLEARLLRDTLMTTFMAQVSPDPDVRAAGQQAARDRAEWYVDFGKDEGLYHAVSSFAATEPELGRVQQRLVDRLLLNYRRAGLELPADERAELTAIEKELADLSLEFQQNIRDDDSELLFAESELRGCSAGFLAGLERNGELYVVPTIVSIARPIWQECEVSDTRQKMSFAYNRRGGPKNLEILERMIALRAKQAALMGYPTFADYQVEDRMAKNAKTVQAFYDDLMPKVRRKALQDFEEYQAAKREHTGDPAAVLHSWDRTFYEEWLKRNRYAVDSEVVRQYLPLENVLDGLFSITQSLYGLRYVDITDRARAEGRPMWHDDVRLFEVRDEASGETIGEFYLDLFPRPNKYSHAAQFPLRFRKRYADGELDKALVALVCNFTKPEADKPSLMQLDEVETLFHEFGHCLHSLMNESELAYFSGTGVARDFVEAPSQMFENWVWDPAVLGTFARHYETGEPLPEELLSGLIAARNLGSGLGAEGQIFLGMTDLAYHMDPSGEVDTTAVAREVYRQTRVFEPMEGTYFQASFGHLTGYAAGYYGYLWSLVYAQDMFGRFEELGLLNPEAGRLYREKILSQGGTRDELDMVVDFLGREPNADAFLRHLGLSEE